MSKLDFYHSEKWKDLDLSRRLRLKYAISNYGRLISYSEKKENGTFVKGSMQSGYKIFRFKIVKEKKVIYKHYLFHRMVADAFLKSNNSEKKFVIHLDFNKTNNHVSNLKWVTQEEITEHNQKNPFVLKARKHRILYGKKGDGHKLTSTQVKLIKKLLADPNRKTRKKMIAKRFKVTTMTLHRIETGENWSHVKAD